MIKNIKHEERGYPKIQNPFDRPIGYSLNDAGVGKTSLLLKYIQNKFSYDYQVTTGIEYFTKAVQVN